MDLIVPPELEVIYFEEEYHSDHIERITRMATDNSEVNESRSKRHLSYSNAQ